MKPPPFTLAAALLASLMLGGCGDTEKKGLQRPQVADSRDIESHSAMNEFPTVTSASGAEQRKRENGPAEQTPPQVSNLGPAVTADVVPPVYTSGDGPIQITLRAQTLERGQELRVSLVTNGSFAELLDGSETFNLVLCYLPDANPGDAARLLADTTFVSKYTTWSRVNGGPGYPDFKPIFTGGNFDNPNGDSDRPGAIMILLNHIFDFQPLSVDNLEKTGLITMPFQKWIMGDTKLLGLGRVAVCLTKCEDHYLKGFTRVSNIAEIAVSMELVVE